MENREQRIHCGSARRFSKHGIAVAICLSQIPDEYIKEDEATGKTWINLTLLELREPKGRQTHSVSVDTYDPKSKKYEN